MLKSYPKALYLTWMVCLILLPLPLILMLHMSLIETTSNLIIYDLGIVAYVWWLAIVYLSTRPQWLDRLIGLPVMYFIHGMLGVFALFTAFFHRLLSFSMHTEIKMTGDWAWYFAVFGIVYASFFLSGWFVDHLPIANRLKQRLQLFFKHEVSIWIHRLHFVMIFLIWLHVHLINRLAILTPFMTLFDLYTVYFIGSYFWQKFIVLPKEANIGIVVMNQALSPTVQKVMIEIPKEQVYQAGDFYFIRFLSDNISQEKHPFSVASSPSKDEMIVTFIIQAVGDFTSTISEVPVGTKVELEGPFGRFSPIIAENDNEVPLVLYGLGSGIAPLKSIAEELSNSRTLHIIWSAKNEEERYFDEEFQTLGHLYPNVTYHGKAHCYNQNQLKKILSLKEIKEGLYFIVGSAQAVLQVKKQLKELGIDKARIHDERLTM